jgi:hypothetical protein
MQRCRKANTHIHNNNSNKNNNNNKAVMLSTLSAAGVNQRLNSSTQPHATAQLQALNSLNIILNIIGQTGK